jgi:hypothetical protein
MGVAGIDHVQPLFPPGMPPRPPLPARRHPRRSRRRPALLARIDRLKQAFEPVFEHEFGRTIKRQTLSVGSTRAPACGGPRPRGPHPGLRRMHPARAPGATREGACAPHGSALNVADAKVPARRADGGGQAPDEGRSAGTSTSVSTPARSIEPPPITTARKIKCRTLCLLLCLLQTPGSRAPACCRRLLAS